jgi:hypothetical protein
MHFIFQVILIFYPSKLYFYNLKVNFKFFLYLHFWLKSRAVAYKCNACYKIQTRNYCHILIQYSCADIIYMYTSTDWQLALLGIVFLKNKRYSGYLLFRVRS